MSFAIQGFSARYVVASVCLVLCLVGYSNEATAQSKTKAGQYYEDALQRYEKKDYAGAVIQLKNVIQLERESLAAQLLLGRALIKNNEIAAAEVALTEAIRLGVDRGEVVVALAQSLIGQGKPALVIDEYNLRLSGLTSTVQAQLLLKRAESHLALGNTREALKSIDESRAIDSRSPDSWLAEVPIRIRARQFKEAKDATDRALALAPMSAEARYAKGSVLHVGGDLPAALTAYDQALSVEKDHLESRVARIGILTDLGRYSEAKRDIDDLRKIAPKDPRGAYLNAIHLEREGDMKGAKASLHEVTNLIDPVPIAYLRFQAQPLMLNGLAHFGLGENDKAKLYLEMFQRLQPNTPTSKLLARLYLTDKSPAQASSLLEGYLRVQPGDGHALNLLASAYMAQGRHSKATALMRQALSTGDNPAFRTALGLSLVRSGQTAAGVVELEASYRKDPKQVQVAVTLIRMYLREGMSAKAAPIAEQLVKRDATNPGYLNLLGLAQAQSGKTTLARASYEKALLSDPESAETHLNIARLDIAGKATQAAKTRLEGVLRTTPSQTDAMLLLAAISEHEDKHGDAQRWFERARDAAGPKDLSPGLQLSQFHLRHGRSTDALVASKAVLAFAQEDPVLLINHAKVLLAASDFVTARATLTAASRAAEHNANQQVEISSLQISARDLGGAAFSLNKALASQPSLLAARALMVEVETRQGELSKAEKMAREIVAQYPRLAIGHLLLGEIAVARGKPEEALEQFRRGHQLQPSTAIILRQFDVMSKQATGRGGERLLEQWIANSPKDVLARKALAGAHARNGRWTEAKLQYEAVLRLRPDDTQVLNDLANVQFLLKDLAAAQKTAEQAVAKSLNNALAIDTLGWILLHRGETDRALQLLREARLRMPDHPEIRYHLGVALERVGRNVEAREELAAAVRPGATYDGVDEARRLLATLK